MTKSVTYEPFENRPDELGTSLALGRNVNRLRKRAHINKKMFCLMVGIGRPFLNRIENGLANPRLSIVERLAEALETTPLELLADPSDEPALSLSSAHGHMRNP